jgi:hypothetical protein
MRRLLAFVSITAFLATAALLADSRAKSVRAKLVGFQEVPAVSTTATGDFRAKINPNEAELTYELEYSGLQGTVTQAHIHFGQRSVNGGIMIWLCGTVTNPGPAGTPVCPASGKVSRTVGPLDVIGPAGQGIAPGEFAEALQALRKGVAYANVHSTMWPGGEIRGQIKDEDRD